MTLRPTSILALTMTLGAMAQSSGQEPTKPTSPASSTNPAIPAAGHSIHGEAFNDGPRRKATLIAGMGKVDFPVTTTRTEAQAFVTQGVAQLHSFYYFEAERSFRQAALIDPDCPMAYWGMAMANVNNTKRAKGFLKEATAKTAKTKITRREQLYIDSLSALYKEGGADRANKKEHLLGLEAIVAEFPNDLDARAWMAMVAWQTAGADTSRQALDVTIESVLDKEPLHPGAHHYRIHLWDHAKVHRAEKAAALYAKSAPGIAHAWHMPGHTYTELKRYADAAYQQEGSARVDHAYMIRDRVMPFEIHNYAHNNQWLATSLGNIGRARDAITVARNLVEQPRDPQKNGPNDGGSPQRSGRLRWVETLVRYELWDDLIAATESKNLDWTDLGPEKTEKAYSLGLAYAAKGDQARLAEQIAALKGTVVDRSQANPEDQRVNLKTVGNEGFRNYEKRTGTSITQAEPTQPSKPEDPQKPNASTITATPQPPKPPVTSPAPPATGQNAALVAELEGYQKLAKGEALPALESFAKATRMSQDALARALLNSRNFGFAEGPARQGVEKRANEFVPLATLVEALHANNKDAEAKEIYRQLEPMVRHADKDTPIARRLGAIVDGWKTNGQWTPSLEPSTDETLAAGRVDLEPLGPLAWIASQAEPFTLADTTGKTFNLAEHKGRNVVVLFYLGGKCAHCMQQLQEFGKQTKGFEAANTDIVAIGTDNLEDAKALKSNTDGVKFPMPFLPDPSLEIFKKYQAFDDFENQPLHGAFLIDKQGNVRFQRISADPFLDAEFLKGEAERINRLVQ
jgi:peroxiredoxin/tetratricopeptide (TPR) repeat protein